MEAKGFAWKGLLRLGAILTSRSLCHPPLKNLLPKASAKAHGKSCSTIHSDTLTSREMVGKKERMGRILREKGRLLQNSLTGKLRKQHQQFVNT